jgi:uncharacterized protein YkwD
MFGFFARMVGGAPQAQGLRRRPTVEQLEARDALTTAGLSPHSIMTRIHVKDLASQISGSPVTVAEIQHNVDQVNHYRSLVGAPPVKLDLFLSLYAAQGSQELLANHLPHQHYKDHPIPNSAENQSYQYGWPLGQVFNGEPAATTVNEQTDKILAQMWAEGPGGGHHDNMANPNYKFLGVGLVVNPNDLVDPNNPSVPGSFWNGALYLTNDFMA